MILQLNGLDFNVEVDDGAGRPPLLLLHGFTGSARAWDEIKPELGAHWRLIAIDLIGHGRSAKPPDAGRYTLDWAARDLVALLDALGLDQVTLLGYSLGGRVALHCALCAPERLQRMILESASPGIESQVERDQRIASDNAMAERIERDGVPTFVAEWERVPLLAPAAHVTDAARARQHALRLQNDSLGLANSLRGMGAGQQQPLWSRLGELNGLPVELIVGSLDARYSDVGARMQAAMPLANLTVVSQAGHTVHVDQPAEFSRLVNCSSTN